MIVPRILLLVLLASATSLMAATADIRVISPKEPVAGESQDALSVKWWQWAASFSYAESPVSDLSGERCGAGQEGNVWFLAGTYASKATRRTCRVPAGKALFFPVINYIVMPQNCSGCLTCEQAVATAHGMTDEPMGLFMELDGKPVAGLKEHRVVSPACFNMAARAKGAPKIEPSASDGYWVALHPLAKGEHTLRFGGSLPSLRQELIYTLIVE